MVLVAQVGGAYAYDVADDEYVHAPVIEPAPEPPPPPAHAHTPAPLSEIQAEFLAGYADGGGDPHQIPRVLWTVNCESSWSPYVISANGLFHGLVQFMLSTWANVGGGDWTSPYQQGLNMARLMRRSDPAGQWPVCWRLAVAAVG